MKSIQPIILIMNHGETLNNPTHL